MAVLSDFRVGDKVTLTSSSSVGVVDVITDTLVGVEWSAATGAGPGYFRPANLIIVEPVSRLDDWLEHVEV